MRKSVLEESHLFVFPWCPIVCQALTTARCHMHSIHAWKEGVLWWRVAQGCHPGCRETKAPGGTAVRSRGDMEPRSCHPLSEAPYSLASCHPCSLRLQIFPPPSICHSWVPRDANAIPLPCSMDKKLCSEVGLVGSLTVVIRKDPGFGWGFVVCLVVGLQQWASSRAPSIIIYECSTEIWSCQEVMKPNACWLHHLAVVAVILTDHWQNRILPLLKQTT